MNTKKLNWTFVPGTPEKASHHSESDNSSYNHENDDELLVRFRRRLKEMEADAGRFREIYCSKPH